MISEFEQAQILFSLHTIINEATYLTPEHKAMLGKRMYKQLKDAIVNATPYYMVMEEATEEETEAKKKHAGYKK